jgi:hypothetical protein
VAVQDGKIALMNAEESASALGRNWSLGSMPNVIQSIAAGIERLASPAPCDRDDSGPYIN